MALALDGIAPLLRVLDMARSVAFYRDVLGFSVMATEPRGAADCTWCMLALGDIAIMLDAGPGAPSVAPGPPAEHRISLYFACVDVDAAYAALVKRGYPMSPPATTGHGMRQLVMRDPDGVELCFQHPV